MFLCSVVALQGLLDWRTPGGALYPFCIFSFLFLPSSFFVLRSYYYPQFTRLVFLASLFGYVSGGADALVDLISEFPCMVDQYCSLPEDGVETSLSPNHATRNVHAAGCPPRRDSQHQSPSSFSPTSPTTNVIHTLHKLSLSGDSRWRKWIVIGIGSFEWDEFNWVVGGVEGGGGGRLRNPLRIHVIFLGVKKKRKKKRGRKKKRLYGTLKRQQLH